MGQLEGGPGRWGRSRQLGSPERRNHTTSKLALHNAQRPFHVASPCYHRRISARIFPQNKCGDAKALDLIMAATATGCTTLSCSWAVDSTPLSVKLNLNVRGAGCMPRAAGLQLHSSMPWRQAAAAAAVPNPLLGAVRLAASHCRILMLYPCAPLAMHPQGCAPTMGLSDTNGDGLVGAGDTVKYCQKGACTSLPFATGELVGGWGWCLPAEVRP